MHLEKAMVTIHKTGTKGCFVHCRGFNHTGLYASKIRAVQPRIDLNFKMQQMRMNHTKL